MAPRGCGRQPARAQLLLALLEAAEMCTRREGMRAIGRNPTLVQLDSGGQARVNEKAAVCLAGGSSPAEKTLGSPHSQ
jgi:hypothetical protein